MKRLMDKLIMYHEIHRLHREGIRPNQIANYLVLDTRTVKKILAQGEQEYLDYQESLSIRDKVLDPYEVFVKSRLVIILSLVQMQLSLKMYPTIVLSLLLKNFGFINEVSVVIPGINAKMNEVQAAMDLLQLK